MHGIRFNTGCFIRLIRGIWGCAFRRAARLLLLQGTAALVVFGGTIGATLLSFPQQEVKRALRGLKLVFQPIDDDPRETIHEIAEAAALSRKEGVLAIEGIRESLKNPLFKRSIKYVIDGFEPQTVKEIMQAEKFVDFEQTESAAKVWEAAGGYAPTIGIIGAVLGLIHVMSGLKDASADLGSGIAVGIRGHSVRRCERKSIVHTHWY